MKTLTRDDKTYVTMTYCRWVKISTACLTFSFTSFFCGTVALIAVYFGLLSFPHRMMQPVQVAQEVTRTPYSSDFLSDACRNTGDCTEEEIRNAQN